jgi:hypothetical protein
MLKTKIHRKNAFVLKNVFRISRISLKIYMSTYDYLYSLDSEKSKVYFFIMFCQGKKILATLDPRTSDKKIRKITTFKANPRIVKIVIVQKSYWLTLFGPLSVRKCQKLGLCWFMWVWNIALKKGFSKLTLRFFMKVTVSLTNISNSLDDSYILIKFLQ